MPQAGSTQGSQGFHRGLVASTIFGGKGLGANAQFAELGVIDRRKGQIVSRSHSARGSSGVVVPLSFPSVGFVYPSAPSSRWVESRPQGAQTQECRHRPGNRARRRRGRLRQRPSQRRKSRPRRRLLRSRAASAPAGEGRRAEVPRLVDAHPVDCHAAGAVQQAERRREGVHH